MVDINASPAFFKWTVGYSPCLTKARGAQGGFYVSTHGRMLDLVELGRLQGVNVDDFKWEGILTKNQFGSILGNAMSRNVLDRLLPRVLKAASWPGKSMCHLIVVLVACEA